MIRGSTRTTATMVYGPWVHLRAFRYTSRGIRTITERGTCGRARQLDDEHTTSCRESLRERPRGGRTAAITEGNTGARAETATMTDERSAANGSAITAGNARGLRRKDTGNATRSQRETTRRDRAGGRRRTRAITRARRRPPSAHRDPTTTVRNQRRAPETQHEPSGRPK